MFWNPLLVFVYACALVVTSGLLLWLVPMVYLTAADALRTRLGDPGGPRRPWLGARRLPRAKLSL